MVWTGQRYLGTAVAEQWFPGNPEQNERLFVVETGDPRWPAVAGWYKTRVLVLPGDYIVKEADGERRIVSAADFNARYKIINTH